MTNVNGYSQASPAYQAYPTNYSPQQQQQGSQVGGANSYAKDGYRASSYGTGYSQGAGAVGGVANGMSGLSSGVGSMANSVGGIFGTIFGLIANILNTIVNLLAKMIGGVLGLFGIGKDKKAGGVDSTSGTTPMPLANNMGQGVRSPAGTAVPPPPPGTDVKAAYDVVEGDVKDVKDPNQGLQIINLHAQKSRDYRDKAEQFATEAEKESRSAAYAAEQLQKNPGDQTALSQLQSHKSKAMDLLKTAQEYTKAVYDESLYAQATNDILNQRFQGAMGQGETQVADAWKNWIGGTIERKFLFFKEDIKAAPELFMNSMNAVNANIGRATEIINSMSGAAR